jgi:hypothetical protein
VEDDKQGFTLCESQGSCPLVPPHQQCNCCVSTDDARIASPVSSALGFWSVSQESCFVECTALTSEQGGRPLRHGQSRGHRAESIVSECPKSHRPSQRGITAGCNGQACQDRVRDGEQMSKNRGQGSGNNRMEVESPKESEQREATNCGAIFCRVAPCETSAPSWMKTIKNQFASDQDISTQHM